MTTLTCISCTYMNFILVLFWYHKTCEIGILFQYFKMVSLNFSTQLRYAVEWFKEFSPMQKSDFLPLLIDKFGPDSSMNGLAFVDEGPQYPSIFQCRIQLFTDWSSTWTLEEKQQFISSIR